jgi:hypothetical protein
MIRTVLVLLALVASGIGFARLTGWGGEVSQVADRPVTTEMSGYMKPALEAKVFITLSGSARSVTINGYRGVVDFGEPVGGVYAGTVMIDRDLLMLLLEVEWLEETKGRNFAKLVVEAKNRETFSHVFDAPGDIDDFVELPF